MVTVSEEDVERELKLYDQLDLVLAIGSSPAPHLVAQKRAVLISKLLAWTRRRSHIITGRTPRPSLRSFKMRRARLSSGEGDDKYELTLMGMRAYELFMKRLAVERGRMSRASSKLSIA